MVFYKVIVDENFHFMDEDESCTAAEYTAAEEAGVHCKKIIDAPAEWRNMRSSP